MRDYFLCPVLDKKDPPKTRNYSSHYRKLYHHQLKKPFKVLKQAKWSVTKNCYTKLAPAQRYVIDKKGAEICVSQSPFDIITISMNNTYISQPSQPRDNSKVINF